jgi:hypothetical protein
LKHGDAEKSELIPLADPNKPYLLFKMQQEPVVAAREESRRHPPLFANHKTGRVQIAPRDALAVLLLDQYERFLLQKKDGRRPALFVRDDQDAERQVMGWYWCYWRAAKTLGQCNSREQACRQNDSKTSHNQISWHRNGLARIPTGTSIMRSGSIGPGRRWLEEADMTRPKDSQPPTMNLEYFGLSSHT